jgi:peptidyl-prolyl cis-trans isomerase D
MMRAAPQGRLAQGAILSTKRRHMLRGIRKASSNWLGKAVMASVMGLLIVSFAIWGIGDIFKGFGRASLVKIGRTEISTEQFRTFYNERLQRLGRQVGRAITPDQARALGLDRQLLGELVAEAALDERARQLNLGVSDAEVSKRITEDPAFRGGTGGFDRSRFEQLIRSAGFTEGRYVAEQRRVMLRRQIAETLGGELAPSQSLRAAVNRYQTEQRSIEYAVLDHTKAGEIAPPTPDVLAKYFDERKALFRAPEYRKLTVLSLTPADMAVWITVTDEEARRGYEDRRARYVTPERRQIQQIVFSNKADAQAAAERLAGGLDFTALAAERGLKDSDISLGLVAKSGLVDRAVAEAAFALKEGEISSPIDGRFGVALVRVLKVEPEQVRGYDQVAAEIKGEIALARAKADVLARHDKIEDGRAAGESLAEIAQKLGLNVRVIDAVDRSGRDAAGTPVVADLPNAADVLQGAFTADVGVETDPIQLQSSGGYVWYEVTGITRSHDRTLDEVKDRVEARWRDDQVAQRLKAKAGEILDKIKAGSFADIAAADGLKVETATELKRGKPSEGLSAGVVNGAFRTAKGAAGSAEGQNPTEVVVFRVTDVTASALDPNSEEAKKIDETLRRSYADDIVGQYLVRLQNELGVTINQAALRQVIGGDAAGGN